MPARRPTRGCSRRPDAKLYDSSGTQVGTHGAGPSWTWRDGSVANGAKVAELNAPVADAISWLLLRVTSTTGAGLLSDATYVQRLNTAGGKAPASGCDATTVGTDTRSGYSADYYFYSGGGASAWLTAPEVPSAIAVPTDVRLAVHDRGDRHADLQLRGQRRRRRGDPDDVRLDLQGTRRAVGRHELHARRLARRRAQLDVDRRQRRRGAARSPAPMRRGPAPSPGFSSRSSGPAAPACSARSPSSSASTRRVAWRRPTGCDASTVDTLVRVPYSADYYFYVSINQLDGGRGPLTSEPGARRSGSVKKKVVPRPRTLSAQIRPAWASTSDLAMKSPSPSPRRSLPCDWKKRSKIFSSRSLGIPSPVSSTAKQTSSPRRSTRTVMRPPLAVNFSAFPTRLVKT